MKFKIGDEIDLNLVISLSHEFFLCNNSFWLFNKLIHNLKSNINNSKLNNMLLYNSYASFLHHLYEFYKLAFKRDLQSLIDLKGKDIDKLFNQQVDKILNRINNITYKEVKCPIEFGKVFRDVRNYTAHADPNRAGNFETIKLSEFYTKYHDYVLLLFNDEINWWKVDDYNNTNWGDITNFATCINITSS